MLEDAIVIAARAHAGQTDRQGAPYIRHCLRVMEAVAHDADAMVVAVLHDVLEDTDTDLNAIQGLGYAQVHALLLLTRDRLEPYEDYIERLCETSPAGTLARAVKRADLADNLGRIDGLPEPKRSMLEARYEAAIEALRGRS